MFEKAARLEPHWQTCAHSLKGLPGIVDIRNLGLLAGIELGEDAVSGRVLAKKVYEFCFEKGVLVRPVANTIVLSPPLTIGEDEVETMFATIAAALKAN
ncbi:adenosylmethionine-8-amino-7-oxononanoate aminotransferase [Ensifer sp. 4252]